LNYFRRKFTLADRTSCALFGIILFNLLDFVFLLYLCCKNSGKFGKCCEFFAANYTKFDWKAAIGYYRVIRLAILVKHHFRQQKQDFFSGNSVL